MLRQIYPAAPVVAQAVEPHFAEVFATERTRGRVDLAPQPDTSAIEAMVDIAFWASLRREERKPPKISLAFLPPGQAGFPVTFEQPLPLTPEALTRLAPAVERPGIHLGVWREQNEYHVWGATRTLPALCFVLEVVEPGLLVIKRRRGQESGKFINVAVLEGDQIKVLDHRSMRSAESPALVASLLGFDLPAYSADSVNVLVQLAGSMRAHGHGGALLVVPEGTDAWRESIVRPIPYSVSPAYSELAELLREEAGERAQRRWQDALRRAIEAVGGLTAVDGAMVLTDRCELLAFGAKIRRRKGGAQVEQIVAIEPIEGAVARTVHPSDVGGTRHLSAAQFALDQRDSTALVASQDGRYTIFGWSSRGEAVHAYRVEALLL